MLCIPENWQVSFKELCVKVLALIDQTHQGRLVHWESQPGWGLAIEEGALLSAQSWQHWYQFSTSSHNPYQQKWSRTFTSLVHSQVSLICLIMKSLDHLWDKFTRYNQLLLRNPCVGLLPLSLEEIIDHLKSVPQPLKSSWRIASPKGITQNWNNPRGVENAVFHDPRGLLQPASRHSAGKTTGHRTVSPRDHPEGRVLLVTLFSLR